MGEQAQEQEYRRGYCDGFIAAVNAMRDCGFMGRDRLDGHLYQHWQERLMPWSVRYARGQYDAFDPPTAEPKCVYCGAPAAHMDHLVPKAQGGTDDPANLVPACAKCNLTKGARTPEEAGMELIDA